MWMPALKWGVVTGSILSDDAHVGEAVVRQAGEGPLLRITADCLAKVMMLLD